jgi:hypothetical protein
MQRDVFASSDAHPSLQAVESIQAAYALLIHRPSLASQQLPISAPIGAADLTPLQAPQAADLK